MTITNVNVKKINGTDRLRAVASITFDDAFAVHDLKIIEGAKGLFVSMPRKKGKDGMYSDIVHPINAEMRKQIEDSILKVYYELEE